MPSLRWVLRRRSEDQTSKEDMVFDISTWSFTQESYRDFIMFVEGILTLMEVIVYQRHL